MSDSLTGQQRLAVEARSLSIALSAGAGCGKTTVLTSRFLGLLEGEAPLRLDEIAAVTFTEKAAREMRDRVRKTARSRLSTAEGDEFERWRSVVRGLESASILTFHGFCAEILRRFPIEAGIEPDFGILEEAIAPSFRERSVDDYLRDRLAAEDPDLITVAVEFGLGRLRDALIDAISGRDRALLPIWAEAEPEDVVAGWIQVWKTRVFPAAITDLVSQTAPLLDLLRDHEPTHPKMKERRAILLTEIPSLSTAPDPIAAIQVIREMAKVQGGGTEKAWPSTEVYQAVKNRLETLREGIKALLKSAEIDPDATLAAARLGQQFARLASGALETFDRAKTVAGMLDFDDLVQKTLILLRDGPPAARLAVRARCKALLVDEFQDTDSLQGAILDTIAGDEIDGGRLFLVGDIKQSIYGFRGARPEVFAEFRERFRPEGRLVLNRNFRSVPGVLDFVNTLFESVFPGDDHALESVRIGRDSPEPAVEFVWADEPGDASRKSASERRGIEAKWLARLVARRVEEGWTIPSSKNSLPRPAHAGDVVFLFRSMTDVAAYEQALANEGLDYHVVGGSAFYGQQEVIDLINVLTVIEDPFNEVSLAGALRGPYFCVSDEALYWMATGHPGGLPAGLENWRKVDHFNDRDESNVRRAHSLLARWRRLKDSISIAALIDQTLVESGAEAALLGEFLGARKRANVRKLVRLARRFDLQGGYTLADFVARLRADLKKPPKEEQAATADEGSHAVRLMSIHQAKGLEFPIVVIPDLNRKSDPARASFCTHPELGLVVKPPGSSESSIDSEDAEIEGSGQSLGWMLQQLIQRREAREESHRLLYVACTRAMDHLILSAAIGPSEPDRSDAMRLISEKFDRLTGRSLSPLPADRPDPVVTVVNGPSTPHSSSLSRRSGPDLPAIAALIRSEAAGLAFLGNLPRIRARPTIIDLDPTIGLPPASARLDRLVRSALADPSAFHPDEIEGVLTRVARQQDPIASASLVALALDRLGPWLRSPLARSIARSTQVRRSVGWSVAWPRDSAGATVFRGSIEFAFLDPSTDAWRIVSIGDARSSDCADRLRVLLTSMAADRLGFGSVTRADRVLFGPGGGTRIEEEFGESELERTINEYFETVAES